MLPKARADMKHGIIYTIIQEGEDKVVTEIDTTKNIFSTWKAAETWVENILKEKRAHAIKRN